MADHVKHAKGELDFSKWSDYSLKKKDHKLDELIEMVEKKEMPLPSYLWTHTEAKLTDEQREAIVDWAKIVRVKYSLESRPQ